MSKKTDEKSDEKTRREMQRAAEQTLGTTRVEGGKLVTSKSDTKKSSRRQVD